MLFIYMLKLCFCSVRSQGASWEFDGQRLPAVEETVASYTHDLTTSAAVGGTCLPRQMPSCVCTLAPLYPS